jgi:hypothetical protein
MIVIRRLIFNDPTERTAIEKRRNSPPPKCVESMTFGSIGGELQMAMKKAKKKAMAKKKK